MCLFVHHNDVLVTSKYIISKRMSATRNGILKLKEKREVLAKKG